MPGTAVSSSTLAARSRLSEPNSFISAFRRVSPSPGTSSSKETSMLVERFCRWYVMANRCASSRTRCSR
jgi:hypothetical protein